MPATLEVATPLQPRYGAWPEKPEPCVNVLCEGPSVGLLRAQELLPGPVVATNHTLALSWRIGVDCWATVDPPEVLWGWAEGRLHPGSKLFCTTNHLLFWQDLLGDAIAERMYCWEPTFMVSVNGSKEIRGENGNPAVLPTITHVLAWLSRLPGTKRVRVFGADMRGSWSNLSSIPFSESESEGWEFRWAVERKLFALSTKKYRERGQRLERWVPH